MKSNLTIILAAAFVCFSNFQCQKPKEGKALTGRLEVKGPCGQFVVSLIKGKMDHALLQASWTDSSTGKAYKNVFAVGNSCRFPVNDMNAGDEFLFPIGGKPQNCMVCMMYYPTPDKKVLITVTKILKLTSQGQP